mmetsp:Transcript_37647/g.73763  ORF Transcript_37647/g.73763 Transcript_37647/m.73763 type:complete len:202 (+) Transcript_37647:1165-1770(+)
MGAGHSRAQRDTEGESMWRTPRHIRHGDTTPASTTYVCNFDLGRPPQRPRRLDGVRQRPERKQRHREAHVVRRARPVSAAVLLAARGVRRRLHVVDRNDVAVRVGSAEQAQHGYFAEGADAQRVLSVAVARGGVVVVVVAFVAFVILVEELQGEFGPVVVVHPEYRAVASGTEGFCPVVRCQGETSRRHIVVAQRLSRGDK